MTNHGFTNDSVFLCACAYEGIADEIAKTLARTIWQGYRIYIFMNDEPEPFRSYKY